MLINDNDYRYLFKVKGIHRHLSNDDGVRIHQLSQIVLRVELRNSVRVSLDVTQVTNMAVFVMRISVSFPKGVEVGTRTGASFSDVSALFWASVEAGSLAALIVARSPSSASV